MPTRSYTHARTTPPTHFSFGSYTGVEGVSGTTTALVINYGFSVAANEHRDFAEFVESGRTLWSLSHGADFDPAHFDAPRGPWLRQYH